MKRKLLVGFLLLAMLTAIGQLFYSQEIKYWLPTPVPHDHVEVEIGTLIEDELLLPGKKKFVHFYNPNCPCSKFNIVTYKELLREFGDNFECYAVIQETTSGVAEKDIDYLTKLDVKIVTDKDKQLARKVGVYATPQIVLLDENNALYYRGNYNQSRYCTNPTTSFARIAIDSLLNNGNYTFPETAFTAYGCVLERETD